MSTQDSVANLLKTFSSIVKEIKQSHPLSLQLKEIQNSDKTSKKVTTTLKFPVATRWGSQLVCLESINVNKYNLQTLAIPAQETAKLDKLSREQILSIEFWIKIEKTISLLKPIYDWIRKIEGGESAISDIPYVFHDLEKHLKHELFEKDLPILKYDESVLKVKNLIKCNF